ncbi:MAG: 23S rRNA (cytosine1962-C5)-methyltransferase [Mariniblastus sp.]|jgi:23S rRNA (cytosine1962-C5)-methyltransferase
MFSPDQYELVDFGDGEKLERFMGDLLIRRPAPVTESMPRLDSPEWDIAVSYDREAGWNIPASAIESLVQHRGICFKLAGTPTGQVGLFPEQVANWDWILDSKLDLTGLKAINLFGYTGGTTMALALRGAEVTHVDAAQPVVKWARENAQEAGLGEAPIRWIAEDAIRFLEREIKRGNRYDIVVADPPSFGRGPKKEVWKIQRDLPRLIQLLDKLCGQQCKLAILSCHTADYSSADLGTMMRSQFRLKQHVGQLLNLALPCPPARTLPSGSCFRFEI